MDEMLITYLDECLVALKSGESVERCLARYPGETHELASLLRIALELENLPQTEPTAAQTHAAKTQFLAQAMHQRPPVERGALRAGLTNAWSRLVEPLFAATWPAPVRALSTAAMSFALLILISGGVVFAASGSLPGDPLYGFKLLGEDVQHALTFDHASRIRLETSFTERRQDEVRQLLTAGRQEEIEFAGLLRERSENQWWIEDIPVVVDADTRVQASPAIDDFVEVHGVTRVDGVVLAQLVEVEGNKITGRVDAIGSDRWQIAGYAIQVDNKTFVQDNVQPGDCVEVHVRRFSDGTLLALEIERSQGCQDLTDQNEDAAETERPTPTATALSGPTPTPLTIQPQEPAPPSATPTAAQASDPTETPEPTVTPTAAQAPNPVETPEPDIPPTPTQTSHPTETPRSTEEPEPTREPEPTAEIEPTEEPESTLEPEDTQEPEPTETPETTQEPDPTEAPESTQEPEETQEPDPTEEPESTEEP